MNSDFKYQSYQLSIMCTCDTIIEGKLFFFLFTEQ